MMARRKISVITEGATEREVGKVLYERGILSQYATPKPPTWKSDYGTREGYDQVINRIQETRILETLRDSPQQQQLFLLFDQEDALSCQERATDVAKKLGLAFHPINNFDNLFEDNSPKLHIILHIADVSIAGINRHDFDGYILQLLQGPQKSEIARALLVNKAQKGPDLPDKLLRKAEEEITELMSSNGYPWHHAKSWLYAYITAFQFRQSHVWFAAEVVKRSSEGEIRQVFASLIYAWDLLAQGGPQ